MCFLKTVQFDSGLESDRKTDSKYKTNHGLDEDFASPNSAAAVLTVTLFG